MLNRPLSEYPGLSTMIQQLNNDFRQEIGAKQASLDQIHAQVVLVTRELAEQRKKISAATQLAAEMERVKQITQNLESATTQELLFEWTRGQGTAIVEHGVPVDPAVEPSAGSPLIQLRRIVAFQRHADGILQTKLAGLEGASAEKLAQYRRVVATCVKLPVDKVDDVSRTHVR